MSVSHSVYILTEREFRFLFHACITTCPFLQIQVIRIRADMFRSYRCEHGGRIKGDRDGTSSMTASLDVRLGWATWSWLRPCTEVVTQLVGRATQLRAWGIVQQPAGAADPRGASPAIDDFLLKVSECLARNFCGLMARSYTLWMGGIYTYVRVLSEDPNDVQNAVRRASMLFPRILALKKLLSTSVCHPEVIAFGATFLWMDSIVYMELLGALAMGSIDAAKVASSP